jgi:para-nitrobenzyl esterase
MGAFHTAEIPYVFNDLGRHQWTYRAADYQLAGWMSSYWVNFAMAGDPNGRGLPVWPPYDRSSESYMDFGESVVLRSHLLEAQLDFIERFQDRRNASR